MDIRRMKKYIKKNLSKKRYEHSLGVEHAALKLADKHNCDLVKVQVAALLHDCAKNFTNEELLKYMSQVSIEEKDIYYKQPQLLHGFVGSIIAQVNFGIKDDDIINGIRYHTTGRENMSLLEKIIYISDYIEPNRVFKGVNELREIVEMDLDLGVLEGLNRTIKHTIDKNELIHTLSVNARNYILANIK
ncbi:MAG: bis(5'-nucleosyl)-tetraphosphatase (symmetrical) YqeK [Anaeromicrobium sp.]|jgi:predicted HD superfamily hydrolase involved in NAD metabolism|uniref:bis(5'-nucleosyl)-tetraphosphatase (symmetrical) YqeK n=1 Tax=Anaeromicrobium sp. TaxID=1929132 RepID=UPI0025E19090|nr:bis(5'-nucleosyl)-tetraphosphatase (symmetrical) YqeK [Anaeromicrobium sp.]MCT4594857.1 bis(5'-nucleosyl)-tetraphosphatase (symmetrical) YqeK [Anaeromicrobium sp.]